MYNEAVRTLLKQPPVVVYPESTLRAVAQTLSEECIGLDPDTTRAQDVMTLDLACAAPEESVLEVATRMLDNEIRHIPVTEDGVVVGVVSERDALRVLVDEHSGETRK